MKIKLRNILEEKKLGITQLQNLTGVSRSTLTPLSKTDILPSKTRFDTLEKICEKLEITESELLSFSNDWKFSLDKIVHLDKQVREEENLQESYLAFYTADNSMFKRYFCLDVTVSFVYPSEFSDEAFKFRIKHNPIFKEGNTSEDKKNKKYEEYEKMYGHFIKDLEKKYENQITLDSIHFSNITAFDLDILNTFNKDLYKEIINFTSQIDLFEIFSSDCSKDLIKLFVLENNLLNSTFSNYTNEVKTNDLYVSLKYKSETLSLHRVANYNKVDKDVYFYRNNHFSNSGITRAYNVKDPYDKF